MQILTGMVSVTAFMYVCHLCYMNRLTESMLQNVDRETNCVNRQIPLLTVDESNQKFLIMQVSLLV